MMIEIKSSKDLKKICRGKKPIMKIKTGSNYVRIPVSLKHAVEVCDSANVQGISLEANVFSHNVFLRVLQ